MEMIKLKVMEGEGPGHEQLQKEFQQQNRTSEHHQLPEAWRHYT